jgi:hypothetical protein
MKKIRPTLEIDCDNTCCRNCHHVGVDTIADRFVCRLYDDVEQETLFSRGIISLRHDRCLADEVKEE